MAPIQQSSRLLLHVDVAVIRRLGIHLLFAALLAGLLSLAWDRG